MENFNMKIDVRWADVDQNGHVRHSAYYDYGAHCRIGFFIQKGFNADHLRSLNIGPILFKEECSFLREIHPDETITINLQRGNISEDGSRWELHHELFNQKGEKAAHISTKGAWIDLLKRKLAIPPQEIGQAMKELPQGDFFEYKKG